jgi:hypothetical protein
MANLPSVLQMISDQLNALQSERAGLIERIAQIDEKLEKAAAQLGLEPNVIAAAQPSLDRLPRQDSRSVGTMPGEIVNILYAADKGYTRTELKDALRATRFAQQIENNQNGFYNAVIRYLKLKKIVEVDGFLYHPSRAPLPEGQEDPTGTHLPANVSNLFASADRKIDVG